MANSDIQNVALTSPTGLARVPFNEYPLLRCTQVDLDPANPLEQIHMLAKELVSDDGEDDVALRGTNRLVHRCERHRVESSVHDAAISYRGEDVEAFQLKWRKHPEFCLMPAPMPQADEVTIAVECINLTGCRFSETEDDTPRGYFAVGIIDKIGSSVTYHPLGHLHCPGNRLGRQDRAAAQGRRHRVQRRENPVLLANGRALGMGDPSGFVKMLACAQTDRILGVHIIGANASELISEAVVAMEFAGASEDLARICHAHPTLSEAVHEAALACDKRALNF